MHAAVRPPAATPRFDTIDTMRGFSIAAVVLLHLCLRFWFAGFPLWQRLPKTLAHLLFMNGGNGVTLFFAISGFLITFTCIRRFGSLAALQPKLFYRIRFARIAPLLALLVAVLSGLALLRVPGFAFHAPMPPLWRAVLAAFTFHLNWLEAKYGFLPACWDVLWSLSVEELFYLGFPLVCLACLRLRHGKVLFVALLLAFVCAGPFARSIWTKNEIWQEKGYLCGMDSIALGCLAAMAANRLLRLAAGHWLRNEKLLLALRATGAAVIGVTALGPSWYWKIFPYRADVYGTLLALAACAVMVGSVVRHRSNPNPLLSRVLAPVRWYGRHSYELYLTHEFLVIAAVFLFLRYYPNPAAATVAPRQPSLVVTACWFASVFLLTAPLGWLVARYVSEPLNRQLRGARSPR